MVDIVKDTFLSAYSNTQLGNFKNNILNTSFQIGSKVVRNKISGYNFNAFIGVSSEESLLNYSGFIYFQSGQVFMILQKNRNPVRVLDFSLNRGDSLKLDLTGGKVIVLENIFYSTHYKLPIYKYRIKNLIHDNPGYFDNADLVLFMNPIDGIVGLYYSVFTAKRDIGKEVIFHIQGDILLLNNNYENTVLGFRNPK
jgi:hypothetical protein